MLSYDKGTPLFIFNKLLEFAVGSSLTRILNKCSLVETVLARDVGQIPALAHHCLPDVLYVTYMPTSP